MTTLTERIDLPSAATLLPDEPRTVRRLALPRIVGTAVAAPPRCPQDDLWDTFRTHFADNPVAKKVWDSSGIASRHYAVDPRAEPVTEWSTEERMQRYMAEAHPLGRRAVSEALRSAGLEPGDLGLFAFATNTGHAAPGVDILVAQDLGMAPDLRRLVIGHMGCHAAVPGLGAVSEYVATNSRPALLLCLDLGSLHVQPESPTVHAGNPTIEDLEQIIAHSLFGDAAAAVVVAPAGQAFPASGVPSLDVLGIAATSNNSVSDHMALRVTDHGFRMRLSPRVPDVIKANVGDLVAGLLARNGVDRADVDGWAVHPGGAQILRNVASELEISEEEMAPSYDVLRDYGNCASPTVLVVLHHMLRTRPIRPGKAVVLITFGPGLTLFAALLKA